MKCPRCGADAASLPECPACGVVLRKARPPGARPRPGPPRRAPAPLSPRRPPILVLLALVLGAAAAAALLVARPSPPASPRETGETTARGPDEAPPPAPVEPSAPPATPPPLVAPVLDPGRALRVEQASLDRLVERLKAGATPTDGDVAEAERLFAQEPGLLRTLLEAVLLQAAAGHREARRFPRADALLERAAEVAPGSPRPRKALLGLRLDAGDWAAAESAGRAALRLAPADAEVVRQLAFALVRQDRSAEAIELLAGLLESRPDADAQALLDRLRQDRGSEQSFDEARIAHFHLRYDGEAHEDVGREILRVLDRHYATLVRTFDHRPVGPIPVILFSEESYGDATGAPSWSAGHYDTFDGRVRVPIGGLTAALTPDLDDTLLHELVHAFVAEMSGGVAPRELHEGIAQLLEGRRTATADAETMRALADGRLGGVRGYYLSALALVEDLVAQRGQGGLNDLLRAMAETGDAERAFLRVYGKGQRALRAETSARLRQRHGS